jgi:3-oxoacyl-(acyl-carrier-protein) synthase
MLRYLSNNVHAVVSAALGARGDGVSLGGPTAGAQAIGSALRALECGAIDAALVVAYDSLIEPETLIEMGARGEASRAGEGSLEAPYSVGAAGFVPGEGAAAVVLERADSAGGRANSFVEVAGSADGGRGEPTKATIARVVGRVARPGDDVIDGAARALPELDALEREAAAEFVAEGASLVAIGASLGRTGAPAALLQAILLTYWLSNGALPPIAGLREGALAKGPLNPLTEGRATNARSAIGISTGASGAAAAIRVQLP